MNNLNIEKKEKEILNVAMHLIKIPAFSIGRFKNLKGISECFDFIVDYFKKAGLRVIEFKDKKTIPGLYCDLGNKEKLSGKMLFAGHYDRVSPISEEQMNPMIDGEWLKARGATDMLCTVATIMVLFKDLKLAKEDLECGLLLVGNEEPGETEKWGTHYILEELKNRNDYYPDFVIVGERTGEGGQKFGKLEYKNRGLVRIKMEASGSAVHTAQLRGLTVVERIMEFRKRINDYLAESFDNEWKTTFTFPYFITGEDGNFNTTPTGAKAGLEIRPIPEQDFNGIIKYIEETSKEFNLEIDFVNKEPGIITSLENQYIHKLIQSIVKITGGNPSDYLGVGKPHATQARFIKSPVIIFGQSGINPHGDNEAHYIPSIMPYYRVLHEFLLTTGQT
ncbi:MAG: M20/M25/M40 family metallo-hydrolase [candidate division WOR-3 bacterium]